MFGFTYLEDNNQKYNIQDLSCKALKGKDYIACNNMINRFSQDKVFYDSEKYLVILDGVIINKNEILKSLKEDNWANSIIDLYNQKGETFFNLFRGSFSGIIKDKTLGKTIIFSDHIGSKILYYIKENDFFFVTSYMPNTYSFMKDNNIHYSMSHEGAYMLLCHGYMIDDVTICEQVKRIYPGHYLVLENNILHDKEFCKFNNKKTNVSIDEAVEIIDNYFSKACQNEFEKDCEYSYKHIASLSGGLDSRMTSLIADELGYKEQLNITFSQSGYWDETIPRQITEDYRHDWIFRNLDSGRWLLDYEDIINVTGGNVLYYGQAHGNSLLKLLNTNDYGILHTGQLGDVFVGRTYAGESYKEDFAPYKLEDRAYSTKYIDKLSNYKLKYEHENKELGVLYNRGFNGMNNGIVCIYNKLESYSPFLDVDFIKQSLQLPVIWNNKNLIYNSWIEKKHPNFLNYGWEALNGHRINEKKKKIFKYEYYKDEWYFLIREKILTLFGKQRGLPYIVEKHNMNPIAYYINHYDYIRSNLNKYIKENINYIQDMELRKDLNDLFKIGNGPEITQALTLIATNKLFFSLQ